MTDTSTTSAPRRRLPVPDGTVPVGIALLIAGIATYAFFRIGTLAVGGDDEFAPIVALWFATFALVPGFFLPLEQELGRALAHRRAVGHGTRPVISKVTRLGIGLVVVIVVVILIASVWITSGYFGGDWWMLLALIATFVAFAPAHLARGVCSGSGRFVDYAIILGSDGVIRIVLCIGLAVVGVTAAGAYGLAIAVSPLFAVAYVWRRGALAPIERSATPDAMAAAGGADASPHDDPHGPPASWSEVTPNLGWLLLGSVFAAGLLNAGPITMTLLAEDFEADLVTRFSYGVLLARVPLFLFQAVQAALLPGLSRLAARGELVEFRAGMSRLAVVVVGVGIAGTLGAFALGPFAIELVYDAELGGRTLAALALASGVYMMALALGQAVIALRGHALVAIGWGLGVVTFVLAVAFASDDLFRRIEIGLFLSSVVSMIAFGVALKLKLDAGEDRTEAESLMGAATPRKWA
jgi:O-antigen/teichoic acid export membrane protein